MRYPIFVATFIYVYILGVVLSMSVFTSFDLIKNPNKQEKNCIPTCQLFPSLCKNNGKCKEKRVPDCKWYCECPANCEGYFCEKLIPVGQKMGDKSGMEVKVVIEKKKKVDISSFDKSKLAQALQNIYSKKKSLDAKPPEGPQIRDRIGKTLTVKETITGTIKCPPESASGQSPDKSVTDSMGTTESTTTAASSDSTSNDQGTTTVDTSSASGKTTSAQTFEQTTVGSTTGTSPQYTSPITTEMLQTQAPSAEEYKAADARLINISKNNLSDSASPSSNVYPESTTELQKVNNTSTSSETTTVSATSKINKVDFSTQSMTTQESKTAITAAVDSDATPDETTSTHQTTVPADLTTGISTGSTSEQPTTTATPAAAAAAAATTTTTKGTTTTVTKTTGTTAATTSTGTTTPTTMTTAAATTAAIVTDIDSTANARHTVTTQSLHSTSGKFEVTSTGQTPTGSATETLSPATSTSTGTTASETETSTVVITLATTTDQEPIQKLVNTENTQGKLKSSKDLKKTILKEVLIVGTNSIPELNDVLSAAETQKIVSAKLEHTSTTLTPVSEKSISQTVIERGTTQKVSETNTVTEKSVGNSSSEKGLKGKMVQETTTAAVTKQKVDGIPNSSSADSTDATTTAATSPSGKVDSSINGKDILLPEKSLPGKNKKRAEINFAETQLHSNRLIDNVKGSKLDVPSSNINNVFDVLSAEISETAENKNNLLVSTKQ